jgi:anti-anti-sigma factor
MIQGLKAETAFDGRSILVSIDGFVPRDQVSEANEQVVALMGKQCMYIILDCSRMTEIGSKGVGLAAYHAAELRRKGGGLLLVPPPPTVARRLGFAPLRKIARFVSSVEEALGYVQESLGTVIDSAS